MIMPMVGVNVSGDYYLKTLELFCERYTHLMNLLRSSTAVRFEALDILLVKYTVSFSVLFFGSHKLYERCFRHTVLPTYKAARFLWPHHIIQNFFHRCPALRFYGNCCDYRHAYCTLMERSYR